MRIKHRDAGNPRGDETKPTGVERQVRELSKP